MGEPVLNPLCGCGCGSSVTMPTNRYIQYHYIKVHWSGMRRGRREAKKVRMLFAKQRIKYLAYNSDQTLLDTYSKLIDRMVKENNGGIND